MQHGNVPGLWAPTLGLVLACVLGLGCTDEEPIETADASQQVQSGGADAAGVVADTGVAHAGGADAAAAGTVADAGRSDAAAPDAGIVADAGGLAEGGTADASTMQPIAAPVGDDCITDVSAGDHTFTCQGLTFLVMVDEMCTKFACGLIFDVHGGTMAGAQMRDNTKLHELAPRKGYLVVHPSATPETTGGSWNFDTDAPKLADFMTRMIKAFHVDQQRVHFTGFSMGSGMTFWFLCNHADVLASVAPISGASADMIMDTATGMNCLDSIGPEPRIPILFMNGIDDQALAIDLARQRVEGLVRRLELTGGEQIAGDGHWSRKRWKGSDHMLLDFIEHDYGGQAVLGGHCIPGGSDVPGSANNFILNATTCTTGEIDLHWGEVVLQWFIEHPKGR
jgi:pimeloyl-ACP methyl ester carboxylesterase